jgi:hypothetical protein
VRVVGVSATSTATEHSLTEPFTRRMIKLSLASSVASIGGPDIGMKITCMSGYLC